MAQVFSVYIALFIPMSAIFWKTVYAYASKEDHVMWFEQLYFTVYYVYNDFFLYLIHCFDRVMRGVILMRGCRK